MGNMRNLAFWVVLMLLVLALFNLFSGSTGGLQSREISYSEFVTAVEAGDVRNVTLDGEQVRFRRADGSDYVTIRPEDAEVTSLLMSKDIPVRAEPQQQSGFQTFLMSLLPILLLIGVWIYFMNRMQGGGKGGAMGFGKSKAKMLTEKHGRVTFDDVAGIDEAKEELEEIVEFLRNPQKFSRLGGKIPKGALLEGPPGTGKTLLARAIAGEAGVPFFTISGSDFVEMFVGVGASRVRDMFEQAKKNAPCIVFIDEIDAVGRSRGAGYGGGNDEREQTLNQLLVEMDGFEANEGVIIIAATNRKDVLDPALLRPGRFDRQVTVGNPDIKGREKILGVHARKTPLGPDVDLRIIARGTPGFSGADLANLVNEAALTAARVGRRFVAMMDFEAAKDKIMMGAERKSMVMSEKEKRNTAYHESGHAIVGRLMPEHDPVYKVSIIPRGRALGVTMFLPEEDKYSHSKRFLISSICSLFGGRIAEELTLGFDGVTTGASNDIERATSLARNMVTRWGLSEKLGPLQYDTDSEEPFLGRSAGQAQTVYSPETAQRIDEEVRNIIDSCYEKAKQLLVDNRDKLDLMADALMKYETIDRHQIDDIMEGREPRPPKGWGDSGPSGGVPADEPEQAPAPKGSDDGHQPGVGRPAGEH